MMVMLGNSTSKVIDMLKYLEPHQWAKPKTQKALMLLGH